MTTIDVQPTTYFTAAAALSTAAGDLFAEVQALYKCLDLCGSMAGSYDEAKQWATKYDSEAALAVELGVSLASTMDTYAKTLRTVGWHHQTADYNATTGTSKGPAPVRPTDPLPAVTMCAAPPPSAGGPGNGLSDVVQLAEKVGITIPDGDTDKLKGAGDAWDAAAKAPALGGLADEIGRIINSVSLVHSPEADTVIADLKNMQDGAQTLFELCGGLAADCYDHKIALGYLRSKLEKQLEDLAAEILKEIGIGLAITVVTSMVTFGIGALIEAARVARIVERFAGPIADMVSGWKKARDFKKAVTAAEKAEKKAKDIQKLEQRVSNSANDWLTADGRIMTDEERWMLKRGPSRDLVGALRRGDRLTAEQQKELDALNSAMGKAPTHAGPVRRDIDLNRDELAGIQKAASEGKPWTANGFMNSTTNPAGATNEGWTSAKNTTFQILSKTGRDMSDLGGTDGEVAFPSNTQFIVGNIKPDPMNPARTIIQLIEK